MGGELVTEDGQAHRLDHRPPDGERQHGRLLLPGAKQVPLPEQLGPEAALYSDATDQHPFQHEQPDAINERERPLARRGPGRELDDRHGALLHRLGPTRRRNHLSQLGVLAQQMAAAH